MIAGPIASSPKSSEPRRNGTRGAERPGAGTVRETVPWDTTPVEGRLRGRCRGGNCRGRRRHGLCRAVDPLHRRCPTRAPRMGLVAARDRVRVRLDAFLLPPAASLAAHRRRDEVASRCPPGDRLQGQCHLSGRPGARLGHGHRLRLPAVPETRGDCPRRPVSLSVSPAYFRRWPSLWWWRWAPWCRAMGSAPPSA